MMKAEKKKVRDSPNIQQSLPAHKRPIPPKNGQIHSAHPQAGEGNRKVLAQSGKNCISRATDTISSRKITLSCVLVAERKIAPRSPLRSPKGAGKRIPALRETCCNYQWGLGGGGERGGGRGEA